MYNTCLCDWILAQIQFFQIEQFAETGQGTYPIEMHVQFHQTWSLVEWIRVERLDVVIRQIDHFQLFQRPQSRSLNRCDFIVAHIEMCDTICLVKPAAAQRFQWGIGYIQS